jgi:hypothetical protein
VMLSQGILTMRKARCAAAECHSVAFSQLEKDAL